MSATPGVGLPGTVTMREAEELAAEAERAGASSVWVTDVRREPYLTSAAALPEDRDDVIGVVLCFEVEEERREIQDTERRRTEDRGLQAVRGPLTQDAPRRPGRRAKVVRHVVEKALNPIRRLQRAQGSQLRGRKAIIHTEHSCG